MLRCWGLGLQCFCFGGTQFNPQHSPTIIFFAKILHVLSHIQQTFALAGTTPILSHASSPWASFFLDCFRLHSRPFTDSNTTSLLRCPLIAKVLVSGDRSISKPTVRPWWLLPSKLRKLCFSCGPNQGKLTFPRPWCPQDAVNMHPNDAACTPEQLNRQSKKKKKPPLPKNGQQSHSLFGRAKNSLAWPSWWGPWCSGPVPSTQKLWGAAGTGGVFVRRKAEKKRIEKFTLNEKWPP